MLINIMLYYKSLRCYIIKRKWNKGERNCTIVHYIAVAIDGGHYLVRHDNSIYDKQNQLH